MSARRASLLTALLLTAALLCAMPGMLASLRGGDANRMDERLRPARTRTLTAWVLSDTAGDGKLLSELCSAFEKAATGVRVFLRRVGAAELTAEDAVLPDIVLYTTGSVVNPEQLFLPLAKPESVPPDALISGQSGGETYGVPLWYAPSVLSLPAEWLRADDEPTPTPKPSSFFDLGTPAPTAGQEAARLFVSADDLPWKQLLQKGALALPGGVALQQLLFVCPAQLRGELIAAFSPTAMNPVAGAAAKPTSGAPADAARIQTLSAYNAAVRAGHGLTACPVPPAVCDRVRYLSLCRDSEDARAFLRFLLSDGSQAAAPAHSLFPITLAEVSTDALTAELLGRYRDGLLFPNAFAHTLEELQSLCLDAFTREADPVETLLHLR